ncbi:MAG TPA: cation acetate symporter [Tepidisphaeraceae bacterium]|nr:cation acetate symporter [Tepidisphaeraceae bacterium]
MLYPASSLSLIIFCVFVGAVLALSFWLGRKAQSAKGYFAAHGQVGWFVNGIAFAGDYLSAASFLGICGMIAFFGYDGFLYSIGYLAGWIVALFVIAEPIKRLGKYTFADALDAQFHSRGIKLAAAISTLIVSLFYLIPQMVGAGALIKPLLGLEHHWGVIMVGVVVVLIVVTAGMVSTTWVQFIKGSLLVIFCTILVGLILSRGLAVKPPSEPQAVVKKDGQTLINGKPQSLENDLKPVGRVLALPPGPDGKPRTETGPLGPIEYLRTLEGSTIETYSKRVSADGTTTTYAPAPKSGLDLLTPGASPTFASVRQEGLAGKLNFLSLMLALFCGTAALPHILIRYYTVKDAAAARKSTVVGIASIGFFYVLTLYLGLGAMTSGQLDPTDSNMAAPLLAKSFNPVLFAIISAIAFTTVLGTVSGLILAASGAVAHDLMTNVFKINLDDHGKVRAGKIASVVVGVIAILLGIAFKGFNVTFLVGWAFNIAASANLPAIVMLLFWRGTTRQGITWSIVIGLVTSLAWIMLSTDAYQNLYGYSAKDAAAKALAPFNQPGIVTIPLSFIVLVVVSLLSKGHRKSKTELDAHAAATAGSAE